jgi:DNA-binding MarR family transcriptional regulator
VSATDDDDLRILVQKLARRIRGERSDEHVSDSQLSVLFRLDAVGNQSPSQLAEHDRVSPPSMNRTVNGLEAAGLVARSPSTADARKVVVTLTSAGVALISETRRLRTAWFSQRLAELSPSERHALEAVAPILRKLAEQ